MCEKDAQLEEKINKQQILLPKEIKPTTYTDIYAMHKYWSKKPPNIVSYFIEKFSAKGDLVLDPFSGYGVTGIEALRLGRKAIIIDLNPVATFLSQVILDPINIRDVEITYKKLKQVIKPRIDSLYNTQCPYCKDEKAIITHCILNRGIIKKIWFECPNCRIKKIVKEPSEEDIEAFKRIYYNEIPFWFPENVKFFDNPRINSKGDLTIKDLFTARNLYAASLLYHEIEKITDIKIRNFFKFVFTGALPQMSNMVFVIKRRGKFSGNLNSLREEVGSWVIGYWVPIEHFEINVWRCFENRYKKVIRGKIKALRVLPNVHFGKTFSDIFREDTNILIKAHDATNLSFIPDESIDYIFTDPPHGDRVPYFELSSLWASWLKMNLDFENEIVISDAKDRNKDIKDYRNRLYRAFKEMYRVLKPGKYISIAFNNLDDDVWFSFLDIIMSVGFELVEVTPLHYSAGSVVQDTRWGGLKSDFIFTCIKKGHPYKPYFYNLPIETERDIRRYVMKAIKMVRGYGSKKALRMYEILNIIVPQLIKEKRAFKITSILKILKEERERL